MPNQNNQNPDSQVPPVIPDQSVDVAPPPETSSEESSNQGGTVVTQTTVSMPPSGTPPENNSNLPPVITPPSKGRRGTRGIIAGVLGLLLLVGGVGAGLLLVKQQQDIRNRASSTTTCSGGSQQECENILGCHFTAESSSGTCSGSNGNNCNSLSDSSCGTTQGCTFTAGHAGSCTGGSQPCSQVGISACGVGNYSTCTAHPATGGCTGIPICSSYSNSTACTTSGFSCSWSNPVAASCTGTYSVSGTCGTHTDQSGCESSTFGCTWTAGVASTCVGTYGGTQVYCSGNSNKGACQSSPYSCSWTPTSGASCTGTPTGAGTNPANCAANVGTCSTTNITGSTYCHTTAGSNSYCCPAGQAPNAAGTACVAPAGACPGTQAQNCRVYECPNGCTVFNDCCPDGTHNCSLSGSGGGTTKCALPECRTGGTLVSCAAASVDGCGQIDKLNGSGAYCGVQGTQCSNGTNSCTTTASTPPGGTCPFISTQAQIQKNATDPWGDSKTEVVLGTSVNLYGFHNGTGQLSGKQADVDFIITKPDGTTITVTPPIFSSGGQQISTFKPDKAGHYTFVGKTKNGSGYYTQTQCQDTGSFDVTGGTTTTLPPELTCGPVKTYTTTWTELSNAQLSSLKAGDTLRLTVQGTVTTGGGNFTKAQFKINGTLGPEVITLKPTPAPCTGVNCPKFPSLPGGPEFYYDYKIPAGTTTFNIQGYIYNDKVGYVPAK